MASVSQIKLQLETNVKYKGGEPVMPLPPSVPVANKLVLHQGVIEDGTDLGAVKVEDGKLVLDMDDFNPDFGVF